MPISVVGVATTTFNSLTSWSCDVPPGVQNGDYLVCIQANAQTPGSRTFTEIAGWTKLAGYSGQDASNEWVDGTDQDMAIMVRVAASEPASYTFSGTGGSMFGTCGIIALRGVDTSAAINAAAGQGTASGTSHATPSITPSVSGCMLLGTFSNDAGATITWTANMTTEQWDFQEPAVFQNNALYTEEYNSTSAVSRTGTSSAADAAIAVLLAITPAAGGGATGSLVLPRHTFNHLLVR